MPVVLQSPPWQGLIALHFLRRGRLDTAATRSCSSQTSSELQLEPGGPDIAWPTRCVAPHVHDDAAAAISSTMASSEPESVYLCLTAGSRLVPTSSFSQRTSSTPCSPGTSSGCSLGARSAPQANAQTTSPFKLSVAHQAGMGAMNCTPALCPLPSSQSSPTSAVSTAPPFSPIPNTDASPRSRTGQPASTPTRKPPSGLVLSHAAATTTADAARACSRSQTSADHDNQRQWASLGTRLAQGAGAGTAEIHDCGSLRRGQGRGSQEQVEPCSAVRTRASRCSRNSDINSFSLPSVLSPPNSEMSATTTSSFAPCAFSFSSRRLRSRAESLPPGARHPPPAGPLPLPPLPPK